MVVTLAWSFNAWGEAKPSCAVVPQTQPAADPWVRRYSLIGGPGRPDNRGGVSIEKVGDFYRLHAPGIGDQYQFVETEPGVLWDRKKVLGTISLGRLTSAAGGASAANGADGGVFLRILWR